MKLMNIYNGTSILACIHIHIHIHIHITRQVFISGSVTI